ncbi:MAG: ATPase, FliI/YscN family [Ilumatobacteraceae bacterium]|nr:ATPase, FliI/YscN family [Ilumatobacteraceae bacterium]
MPNALAELDTELPASLAARLDVARGCVRPARSGAISRVIGLRFDVDGLDLPIGATVKVVDRSVELSGEVVAVGDGSVTCMPFGEVKGLRVGARVEGIDRPSMVAVGPQLLGRVIDAMGRPLDDLGPIVGLTDVTLDADVPHPMRRARIDSPLSLGIRSWDTLIPAGRGQRVGIFAGSGVGKSTLLGMIARNTAADVNVVALIGERGREVREFVEADLGPEGLARSVLIVATSDAPALVRFRAAFVATRIAEWFRDQGNDVMLMMDSLTRFCMAQREIGLSAGEPPTSRGYPPSVFSLLPRLLERAGAAEVGSITGLYTVLVDGDDHNEPISDAARSILDGHVVLSRKLAHANHYPAIDVLSSVSRVTSSVTTNDERNLMYELRRLMAAEAEARDLIEIGAYVPGSNPQVDRAIELRDGIRSFLTQRVSDQWDAQRSFGRLRELLAVRS